PAASSGRSAATGALAPGDANGASSWSTRRLFGGWMRFAAVLSFAFTVSCTSALAAQTPLAPVAPSGQTATPAFEGWYRNADGTYSLSFGYFNRNTNEVLNIPVGPENFISPGEAN